MIQFSRVNRRIVSSQLRKSLRLLRTWMLIWMFIWRLHSRLRIEILKRKLYRISKTVRQRLDKLWRFSETSQERCQMLRLLS
jgi:hypothetical protein